MKQTGAPASSPHARHAKRRWRACVRPNGLTGVTGDLRKEAPLLLLPAAPSVSPPLGVTSLLHARHQELIFPRARPASGVCGSESERVIFTPAAIELAALACAQTPFQVQAKRKAPARHPRCVFKYIGLGCIRFPLRQAASAAPSEAAAPNGESDARLQVNDARCGFTIKLQPIHKSLLRTIYQIYWLHMTSPAVTTSFSVTPNGTPLQQRCHMTHEQEQERS